MLRAEMASFHVYDEVPAGGLPAGVRGIGTILVLKRRANGEARRRICAQDFKMAI